MRSIGLQPGEELLPEAAPADSSRPAEPFVDEVIVSQLASMGFNYLHCQKAAINTSNTGIEESMNWLLTHMDDPDINDPIVQEADTSEYMVDEGSLSTMISFGFQENVARTSLKGVGGDIERATYWIFSHPDESSEPDATAASSSVPSTTQENLPDGGGKYKLKAIVSHIGTSTQCGHYVAHVHKDGRWVIFNDSKVGASVDPPKDMGYMYLFERIVQ